jgi:hypothetical protein
MRGLGLWIVAIGLFLGVASAPASASPEASPFTGTWTSVDTDESHQVMTISGSGEGALALRVYDDAATVCGGDPARIVGSGRVDGDLLGAAVTVVCIPGGNVLGIIGFDVVYDADTDTLTDFSGVVWTRQ